MPDTPCLTQLRAILSPHELAGAFLALDSFDDSIDDDTPDGAYFAMLDCHAEKYLQCLPKATRKKLREAGLDGQDIRMAWIEQSPKWKMEDPHA